MSKTLQSAVQRRADNALIRRALKVMEERLAYGSTILDSPLAVRNYLRLRMSDLEHEVFIALWLDNKNALITSEELSRGTLTQTAVYSREVVKSALAHNAGGVILAHNHPSGRAEPSNDDKALTMRLKQALELIDVRLLDHFIVGDANTPYSFAERGLL